MLVLTNRRVAKNESHHPTVVIVWLIHRTVLEDDVLLHPWSVDNYLCLLVLGSELLSDVAVSLGILHSLADFQSNSVTAIVRTW